MRKKNPEHFRLLEEFIDSYILTHDRSPSQREIAEGTGMSAANVCRYLSFMRKEGMIDYDGTRNYTTHRQGKMNSDTVVLPLLGCIACGTTMLEEENVEEYVRLPASWIGRGDHFLLRTEGCSMIDIGIDDGDLVIVRKQDHADDGQVIVALIEDVKATLKRYFHDDEKRMIRLHPENEEMEDIYLDENKLRIQGVAIKLLKDIV